MSLSFLNTSKSYAIIGTAGRGTDKSKLTVDTYDYMFQTAKDIIGNDPCLLISGGAAWADHIAVRLFLEDTEKKIQLKLHLPCGFVDCRFTPKTIVSGIDIGKAANYYHEKFSTVIKQNSFTQLNDAINQGAEITISNGFFDRNHKVAKADAVIAFTFGVNEQLKDGGTSHTVKSYFGNGGTELHHVNLENKLIYKLDYFP